MYIFFSDKGVIFFSIKAKLWEYEVGKGIQISRWAIDVVVVHSVELTLAISLLFQYVRYLAFLDGHEGNRRF